MPACRFFAKYAREDLSASADVAPAAAEDESGVLAFGVAKTAAAGGNFCRLAALPTTPEVATRSPLAAAPSEDKAEEEAEEEEEGEEEEEEKEEEDEEREQEEDNPCDPEGSIPRTRAITPI